MIERPKDRGNRTPFWVGLAVLSISAAADPAPVAAQEGLCRNAERFMVEDVGMIALSEPDTIDDWRTRKEVPGCRVTAAGITTRSISAAARDFFERIRSAGWTRTPDPRDAPNEASLRFRLEEVDCLFSFYTDGLLGTDAEGRVLDVVLPGPGERRYSFFVMCMPAMEAAPRGGTLPVSPRSAAPSTVGGPTPPPVTPLSPALARPRSSR